MTLTGFTSDPTDFRTRPRKRQREAASSAKTASSGPSPGSKPHSNPTAAHPPLRRLFASAPSPILSDKRYGNVLDPLLTDLLALTSKQFILSWYGQICPLKENTKPFSARVTQILVHLIREFERRLVALDPIPLVLVDLPTLFNRHLLDIYQARCRVIYQRQRGLESDVTFDQVFTRLRPHPGIQLTTALIDASTSTTKLVNPLPKYPTAHALPSPTYLRLLVETIMERVLPAEDWAPETERLIIREIIVNVILAPFFCNLTEPSTIYRLIGSLLAPVSDHSFPLAPPLPPPASLKRKLLGLLNSILHFLLLLPSLYQSITNLPPLNTTDAQIFEPSLTLIATIARAEKRPQVRQLCWILSLVVRLLGGLLTRLFVHMFYTTLISPITLSHLLIKSTILLEHTTSPTTPSIPLDPQEVSKILSSYLSSHLCTFLEPGIENEEERKELVARELLGLVAEQSANLYLLVQVFELCVVRLFPELAEWEEEEEVGNE